MCLSALDLMIGSAGLGESVQSGFFANCPVEQGDRSKAAQSAQKDALADRITEPVRFGRHRPPDGFCHELRFVPVLDAVRYHRVHALPVNGIGLEVGLGGLLVLVNVAFGVRGLDQHCTHPEPARLNSNGGRARSRKRSLPVNSNAFTCSANPAKRLTAMARASSLAHQAPLCKHALINIDLRDFPGAGRLKVGQFLPFAGDVLDFGISQLPLVDQGKNGLAGAMQSRQIFHRGVRRDDIPTQYGVIGFKIGHAAEIHADDQGSWR